MTRHFSSSGARVSFVSVTSTLGTGHRSLAFKASQDFRDRKSFGSPKELANEWKSKIHDETCRTPLEAYTVHVPGDLEVDYKRLPVRVPWIKLPVQYSISRYLKMDAAFKAL